MFEASISLFARMPVAGDSVDLNDRMFRVHESCHNLILGYESVDLRGSASVVLRPEQPIEENELQFLIELREELGEQLRKALHQGQIFALDWKPLSQSEYAS